MKRRQWINQTEARNNAENGNIKLQRSKKNGAKHLINQWIDKNYIDIACIQETHQEHSTRERAEKHELFFSTNITAEDIAKRKTQATFHTITCIMLKVYFYQYFLSTMFNLNHEASYAMNVVFLLTKTYYKHILW